MRKLFPFLFLFLVFPFIPALAQDNIENETQGEDEIFKARVVEILEENKSTRENGSLAIFQKLKLVGLEKEWKGKEIIFDGTKFDIISSVTYRVGDKVLVSYNPGVDGEDNFYVIGFFRQNIIYWLAGLFAILVILVGRLKGVRALLSLLLTFVVILKFIIPRILAGGNPLLATIIGSFFILILVIYFTEGINLPSTIAIVSVVISLAIVGASSLWFTSLTKLTGFASDDVVYLVGFTGGVINLQGLLLAGILIGALGVLDDVVISQVTLVRELKKANPSLSRKGVYKQAMKVGVSHLSSMVNTLFLAYAGAALPLLILFSVKQPPFLTFGQVLNHEVIATEIVRTLAGSVGIILAVPIATFLAASFVKIKGSSEKEI